MADLEHDPGPRQIAQPQHMEVSLRGDTYLV